MLQWVARRSLPASESAGGATVGADGIGSSRRGAGAPADDLLAYPEAVEYDGGVGTPSFTVREKIFAMRHPHEGRPSMWCKAPQGIQAALVETDPGRYLVPPYVGHRGWVGVWLDVDVDWVEVEGLVDESYRMTAPKRLVAQLG